MIPSRDELLYARTHALRAINLPELGPVQRGKVRDSYVLGDRRLLITTDRLSAFDRVLGVVPYKGQVLNQLSRFWFEALADVIPSHMISVPDPNSMLANIVGPIALFVKIMAVAFLIFWFRFTYPRFREDQLQTFAWKYLIPLSLVNITLTGVLVVAF